MFHAKRDVSSRRLKGQAACGGRLAIGTRRCQSAALERPSEIHPAAPTRDRHRRRRTGGERQGHDRSCAGRAFQASAYGHRAALSSGRVEHLALGRRSFERVRGGSSVPGSGVEFRRSGTSKRARFEDRVEDFGLSRGSGSASRSPAGIRRPARRRSSRRTGYRLGDRSRRRLQALRDRLHRSSGAAAGEGAARTRNAGGIRRRSHRSESPRRKRFDESFSAARQKPGLRSARYQRSDHRRSKG